MSKTDQASFKKSGAEKLEKAANDLRLLAEGSDDLGAVAGQSVGQAQHQRQQAEDHALAVEQAEAIGMANDAAYLLAHVRMAESAALKSQAAAQDATLAMLRLEESRRVASMVAEMIGRAAHIAGARDDEQAEQYWAAKCRAAIAAEKRICSWLGLDHGGHAREAVRLAQDAAWRAADAAYMAVAAIEERASRAAFINALEQMERSNDS